MIDNEKEIIREARKLKENFEIESETQEDIINEKISFLDRLNELVRLILKDNTVSVYDALTEENLKEWNKRRNSTWFRFKTHASQNFRKILYFMLLATITGFLVSEALGFYALDGIVTAKTYVKAILTEVCFIFLSGYGTESKGGLLAVSILRASIFGLMMFIITSTVLIEGTTKIENTTSVKQQIVFIQEQIDQKEKDIKYFKEIGYPRNATRVTIEKQKLVTKLISLKEQQAKGANEKVSDLEKYRMYGRAFFRVLLLFISALITRRLFSF